MSGSQGVKKAPLAADDREIFRHLFNVLCKGMIDIVEVMLQLLPAAFQLCNHQILVRVQHHIFVSVLLHEIFPDFQLKSVVEHNIFILRQKSAHPVISLPVIPAQELCGVRPGPGRLFLIHCRIAVRHIHGLPDALKGRLVDDLNAPQPFSLSIAFCQPLQYSQFKLHLFRLLRPSAHAADPAVVKAVLTVRRRMQINQNLKAVFLRPVKCLVELCDAADERFPVSEDKIRHRNPHRIHAHGPDPRKIALRDIFRPVYPDPRLIHFPGQLCGQIVFIFRRRPLKQSRTHPFLQYQPVAEIYSFYVHDQPPILSSASALSSPQRLEGFSLSSFSKILPGLLSGRYCFSETTCHYHLS